MSEARVKVSLNDVGTIEFEGTEAFVTAQLEKFGESIRAGLAVGGEQPPVAAEPPAVAAEHPAVAPEDAAGADALDDIFAATETGVRIITDIPGYRVYEKMPNAAKLLAYG